MRNLKVTVNGTPYDVQVEEPDTQDTAPSVSAPAPSPAPKAVKPAAKPSAPSGSEIVSCPMPGTIVSVNVKAGQNVKKGDVLVVFEAMKMENEIMAPHDAKVAAVMVNKGESVETGAPLVSLQ